MSFDNIIFCGKKAGFSKNENEYYCNIHAKQLYKSEMKKSELKSFKIKNSKSLNFDDVKLKLIYELEKRKNLLNANAVVIENQPSFKNPRMKSIASTIYDYYLIRGVIDKQLTKSNIEQVKFQSPSNKLKLADSGDTKQLIKAKASDESTKAYKLTKSLGIKYCLELTKHLPKWQEHFNKHKKKDDLADAFLQGAYFIDNVLESKEKVVLSFDVGVVHLAYCLLTKNNKSEWEILDWNNIDLTDRDEQKCECGKKASFSNITNGIQKYYCKVHSKKIIPENKSFETIYSKIVLNNDNKKECCYKKK